MKIDKIDLHNIFDPQETINYSPQFSPSANVSSQSSFSVGDDQNEQ